MKIKNIILKNFRNYTSEKAYLKEGINFLVGENAQGKTNLLESIYFCAMGKSPKTSKDKMLITFGQNASTIKIVFDTIAGEKSIKIDILDNKKSVQINGINILRLTQLIGELNVVYFSPDELKLVKDVPEDRRHFLDISISQFDKDYMHALLKYEKVLKQRNCILKSGLSEKNIKEQLSLFTPQLVELGAKIIRKRIKFIENLKVFADQMHKSLTSDETLDITYSYNSNAEDIEKDLQTKFDSNFEKEVRLGFTLFGPHRDDMIFKVNDKDCRYYSSQGQQRTVALSLVLANMEIIKNEVNEYPILLLDDVMSELDKSRKDKLIRLVSNYQTIITSTQIFDNKIPINTLKIHNGKIEK